MSYALGQEFTTLGPGLLPSGAPVVPDTGFGSMGAGTQVLVVGGVVAVVGLMGFLAYQRMKVTQAVIAKHGVGGALAFEGGMAAIGALSRPSMRRNPKRRRTSRRRRP